jgi:phosphate transport system substrate-binding protein
MREDLEATLVQLAPRGVRRDDVGRFVGTLFAEERARVGQRLQVMLQAAENESVLVGELIPEDEDELPDLLTPSSRRSKSGSRSASASKSGSASRSGSRSLSRSKVGTGPTPQPLRDEPLPSQRPAEQTPPTSIDQKALSGTTRRWPLVVAGILLALVAGVAYKTGLFSPARVSDGTHPDGVVAPTAATAPADTTASASKPAATLPTPQLRLCGSNTIGSELAPALVEAFLKSKGNAQVQRQAGEKEHQLFVLGNAAGGAAATGVAVRIESEGSATAFEGLLRGDCDLGMASRPIKDDEQQKLKAAGVGDLRTAGREQVLGLDGIAVIVNASNPVHELSLEQVRGLFSGEIRDWSKVGGEGTPVTVYARDDKSGTYDTFKNLAMGSSILRSDAKRFTENQRLADEVATDPSGIGFVGLAYVRTAKAVAVRTADGSAGLYPSAFTVTTEDYPLSRRLFLYSPSKPTTPMVQELISFALSADGQKVVRDTGFVDLSVVPQRVEACDSRCPAHYAEVVKHAQRLSLDFRFGAGDGELDSRGQRDIDRLLNFLRAHPSGQLMLLGFSDSEGNAQTNQKLSLERAKKVDSELGARGVHASIVEGFGSAMPVASNADPAGRERNRRVEVWLDER